MHRSKCGLELLSLTGIQRHGLTLTHSTEYSPPRTHKERAHFSIRRCRTNQNFRAGLSITLHARSRGCWNTVEDVQPSWRSIPLYRLNCIGVRQRYVAGPPSLYAGIAHSIVRSEIPAVTLDINLS